MAAGTYTPGTNRTDTFQLKDGVAIYGGFAGTESARDDRDPATNLTILSGEIGDENIITDNNYHVVSGDGLTASAVLDGFIITAGNADDPDDESPDSVGGGMYLTASSPTLSDITFSANTAYRRRRDVTGETAARPSQTSTFNANTGLFAGGGMFLVESSPTLTNVTFSANAAIFGGGMVLGGGSPILTNVTFSGNTASYDDNGRGGGMYLSENSPTLTNVTFSGNVSDGDGGGMYLDNSSPILRNSILWGNTAAIGTTSEQQIYTITDTPVVSDSVIEGGYAGVNIKTNDPKLANLGNYGGFTQTIPLLPGSSAIDAGDNCPLTDQRGNSRVGVCDIGAFESQGFTFSSPTGTNQSTIINTAFATPLGLSVTANAAGEPVDGGVVTFTSSLDNTWRTNPATFTAVIAGGVVSATATANEITGGPYPVTASATGVASGVSFNLTNNPAPTTTSTTTTILTAFENFDIFGESWSLSATVTSESGTPSGTVTFKDGTQILGTAALTNGVASFNTGRLPGGDYIFTAEYDGSDNYTGSVSNALNLTANYYNILPLVFR